MAEAIKMGGSVGKIPNGQQVLAYSFGEKVKSNTFVKSITDLKSKKPSINSPSGVGTIIPTYENCFDDNAILASVFQDSYYYLKIFKLNEKNEISAEGSWLQINFPSGFSYNITNKNGCSIIIGDYIIFLVNQMFDTRDYRLVAVLCKRNGVEISFLSFTQILSYDRIYAPSNSVQWSLFISKMKENKIAINMCASYYGLSSGKYITYGFLCDIANNKINIVKSLYSYTSGYNEVSSSSLLRGIKVNNSSDGELCWVSGRYMDNYPISATPFVDNPKFFNYNGDVVDYKEMTHDTSKPFYPVQGYIYPLGNNQYLIDDYKKNDSNTGYTIVTIDLINKRITLPLAFYRGDSAAKVFILYKNKVYIMRNNFIYEFLPSTRTMVILTDSASHKLYNYIGAYDYSLNEYNNIKYSYINSKDYITFFVGDLLNDNNYFIANEIPVDRWLPESIIVDDTSVTKDNLYGVTQTTCSKNKKGKVTVPLSV